MWSVAYFSLLPDLRLAVPKKVPTNAEQAQREKDFSRIAIGPDAAKMQECIDSKQDEMLCGKLKTLKLLLNIWDKQSKKVLVFSSRTSLLDLIQQFLEPRYGKARISRLDGSTPIGMRQDLLDEFAKKKKKKKRQFFNGNSFNFFLVGIIAKHKSENLCFWFRQKRGVSVWILLLRIRSLFSTPAGTRRGIYKLKTEARSQKKKKDFFLQNCFTNKNCSASNRANEEHGNLPFHEHGFHWRDYLQPSNL